MELNIYFCIDPSGVPERIALGEGAGVQTVDRSYPKPKSGTLPISGIEIFHEGPMHVHDCKFFDFRLD